MKRQSLAVLLACITILVFFVVTSHAADTARPAGQVAPVQAQKQTGKPAQVAPSVKAQATQVKAPEQAGPPVAPKPPTNLTATSPTGTRVVLTWKDNANNEQGFEIERRTPTTSFKNIGNTIGNLTTTDDLTVSPNNTYIYRMRAYNTVGTSPYSNEATVTLKMPTTAVQCPPLSGHLSIRIPGEIVPAGWQTTDYGVNVTYTLNQATVFLGKLECVYNVPAGTVAMHAPFPAGKTCKDVDRKYFECN